MTKSRTGLKRRLTRPKEGYTLKQKARAGDMHSRGLFLLWGSTPVITLAHVRRFPTSILLPDYLSGLNRCLVVFVAAAKASMVATTRRKPSGSGLKELSVETKTSSDHRRLKLS